MIRIKSGFSLIELIFSMGLLVVVMSLAFLSVGQVGGKASAGALASMVAEQFRLARQDALSSQEPVAVCFPSDQGQKPHCQGLYIARGMEIPRITRVEHYAGEYSGAVAFVGVWPESTGSLTVSPPAAGKSSRLDLNRWLTPAMKEDYCFVFTPEGAVVTNSLPFYDGAYHVLVSAGANYSGGVSPPGAPPVMPVPAYFSPTSLGETATVSVSPSGAVQVEGGVARASTSPVVGPRVQCSVPPAQPPALPAAANLPPVVASVQVYPKLDPSSLAPGVDVMVSKGGHVTLVVVANDPAGTQLFLTWTCSDGKFSYPGEEKMQWDSNRQAWLSYWQWSPPETAAPGQQFTLNCSVRNLVGQVAVPVGPSSWNVGISPPGVIAFQRPATSVAPNGNYNGYDICVMNPDGGESRAVIQWNSFVPAPSVSRDGTKITWCELGGSGHAGGIYVANVDGSDPKLIQPGFAIVPSFSPYGDRVAFISLSSSNFNISVKNSDGSGVAQDVDTVAVGGYPWNSSSWSPDGQKLCYWKSNSSGGGDIWAAAADQSSAPQNLTNNPPGVYVSDPSWCPDPTNPVIIFGRGGLLDRMNSTGALNPFPSAVMGSQASFSPDGGEILFQRNNLYRINSLGTGGLKQITSQASYYGSWGP